MGENENGNRHINKENGINLKNGFDLHRKFLEDIDCGRKIAKNIFPLNFSLKMEKFKIILQSENGDTKSQGDLEESEAGTISFELF